MAWHPLTGKGGSSLRPHETRTRIGNSPPPPSSIATSMPVSRIREIMELAWKDPEAIHLEVGETDFPTPEHVVEAAHRAARMGLTRYAPNAGIPELREALAEKVARRNGYGASPEQVVTPRTRAILVNSPSNPLGTVVPRGLMEGLLAFARGRNLWFISDEVYDEVVFDDVFVSAGSVADSSDRLGAIYSFSKVYAMTGWRVGYLVAPPDLAKLLTGMQEPIISCVNTPAQMAALTAVTGPQDVVREMRKAY